MTTILAPDTLGPTLTLGEILVEIVATTKGFGFTEAQPLLGPFPSGAPAIFISQCGRIGGQAAMIGAVGADDFGALNRDRLHRDGVDISAIRIDPALPTGSAFVRYRPEGARDFVFNIAHSAAGAFGLDAQTEAVVARAGHLHVMGSGLMMPAVWAVLEPALRRIKARGGTVSFDPNLRKELAQDAATKARFARVLAQTDLLLPSGEELELAAGAPDEASALAALFALGIKEIVVKRGAQGATSYRADGSALEAPRFRVEERDPTGAGDCFGGAYVAASRLGLSRAQALRYAAAAGARNVTALGPMEGAGTRAELDAFIAQQECDYGSL